MVPQEQEDLPASRAPSLGRGISPWLEATPLPSLASVPRKTSAPAVAGESTSLTSFKTCPSDSNLATKKINDPNPEEQRDP